MSAFADRAAALRQAFDRSFALPAAAPVAVEDLLAIRVAGLPYALRLRDLAGIAARRPLTPVPAVAPGLLGLAGVRGRLVPVFALAPFLGHGPGDGDGEGTWLALCGGRGAELAVAFAACDGHLRLDHAHLHAEATDRFVDAMARTAAGLRPVLALPRLVATIRDRSGHPRTSQEP